MRGLSRNCHNLQKSVKLEYYIVMNIFWINFKSIWLIGKFEVGTKYDERPIERLSANHCIGNSWFYSAIVLTKCNAEYQLVTCPGWWNEANLYRYFNQKFSPKKPHEPYWMSQT